jgi:hypothetical protein
MFAVLKKRRANGNLARSGRLEFGRVNPSQG